jgi:tight adherence protein B
MPLPRLTGRRGLRLGAAAVAVLVAGLASPAIAAEGSIDHVESRNGKVQVLYSLPDVGDATPDLKTLSVTLDGEPVDATATLASDAKQGVRRTAILAIDVSESMAANGKFAEAKRAAQTFLDSAPADLYVGVVTFAGSVSVAQEPTLDRGATSAVIQGLKLSYGTLLYDGVLKAVSASGKDGQRSVIVLSDGRDTGATKLTDVTAAVKTAEVKVDVVALAQSAGDEKLLEPLSAAGNGAVISANDPKGLAQVFADEAQTLAKQIQITATPAASSKREGTLTVTVDAGDQTFSDAAFVTVSGEVQPTKAAAPSTDLVAPPSGLHLTSNVFFAGLIALGGGLLVLLVALFGGLGKKPESLSTTIAPYTRKGAGKRVTKSEPQGVTAQAVGIASKALQSNKGLEVKLGDKLEAGGLAIKPAEWLLIHAGIAFGVTFLIFLLSGGDLVFSFVTLVLGIIVPWVYLGRKQSKRLKAFNSQLAATLQLMAGSLQAGLSLPQGMDTIVREGAEPMSTEFRRALVETRLGVAIEDALESIGERMHSDDFQWTVMAIRIQREVGGNLAELLLQVAATLRERDYLRRQVKSLSAEGRFSAYILLAMPPCILAYEYMTNRAYLEPLYTTGTGYVMLGVMGFLMGLGAFMMNRMIKLEV